MVQCTKLRAEGVRKIAYRGEVPKKINCGGSALGVVIQSNNVKPSQRLFHAFKLSQLSLKS